MIHHLVLFRWKKAATPAQVEQAIEALRALPAHVPGIADLAVGPSLATGSYFDCGLAVQFPNQAALDAYDSHPHHLAVIQASIEPILKQLAFIDFAGTNA